MRTDYVRAENLDVFSAIASLAFEEEGRGAIVVDVTSQPVPGAGHPFAYFGQEAIEGQLEHPLRPVFSLRWDGEGRVWSWPRRSATAGSG